MDAAAGQDAVNVANAFNKELHLTGVIMSRLDGDARGGAALSIKYLTGLPIKFAGVGEKITDMEIFYRAHGRPHPWNGRRGHPR